MNDFVQARAEMLRRQLVGRGIHDPAVLDAMRYVPRHAFVSEAMRASAYDDTALPIEAEEHLRNTLLATRLRRWRVTLVALKQGDNARCPGWDDVGGLGRRSSHGRRGRNCCPLQRRCLRRRGYGCRRPRLLLLLRFLFHLLRRLYRNIRVGSGFHVGRRFFQRLGL